MSRGHYSQPRYQAGQQQPRTMTLGGMVDPNNPPQQPQTTDQYGVPLQGYAAQTPQMDPRANYNYQQAIARRMSLMGLGGQPG